MPVRIQRKRSKGWKMPDNTIYVGRPTIWGNPFNSAEEYRQAWKGFNGHSELYRHLKLHGWVGPFPSASYMRFALGGKNLACWCNSEKPCHADVLLEIANEYPK